MKPPGVEDTRIVLPPDLVKRLAGITDGYPVHTARLQGEGRAILEGIAACRLQGSLKRLYVEGAILELMALRLSQLEGAVSPGGTRPAHRREDRLHEARAILLRRMDSPPSIRGLAKEVAMSATDLKRGFRALFGQTVFGYVRGVRMERCAALLRNRGISVKEAAHAVGYSSLSHFARAFRRVHGTNPESWSRHET